MSTRLDMLLDAERRAQCEASDEKSERDTTSMPEEGIPFVGWMLWNIVRSQHVSRGVAWPLDDFGGIFEDMPQDMQTAWNRAAADLQQRAKIFGRLM